MTEAPEKPGGSQPSSKSEGAEQPAQQSPAKAPDKSAAKEARTKSQRSLFIMVMLMFFVSIVVFVVGTYFFVVPHVVTQNMEIRYLQTKLNAFEDAILASDSATEEADTPKAAPAAPDAPEVKPVELKKKAPKKKAPDK